MLPTDPTDLSGYCIQIVSCILALEKLGCRQKQKKYPESLFF